MPVPACETIADAVLAGLENDPNQRLSLAELQKRLRQAQHAIQASQKALNQAQDAFAKLAPPLTVRHPHWLALWYKPLTPDRHCPKSKQPWWVGWRMILASGSLNTPTAEIILWFDPQCEWEPILPLLAPHLNLIRDDDSPLHLRYQLEQRQPGRPVVVYSPSTQEEADYLEPFTFIGRVFDQSLYDFLLAHGSPVPGFGDERKTIQPLLPLLAAASQGKGDAFWQNIKTWQMLKPPYCPNFESGSSNS